ncbi:glycoside hydrolase family 68 protein [Streptomyces scabiei]|uniref:glycoside hydrolase family 68 protein n=1 Tax=Streptomyces scabiei TaxID=1930 RepID=UPI000B2B104F|nr:MULTISPECIES: glycoside hydrolase family 68 protein [Streptomyces]MDW8476810.1 glycoside hydrolase family 68 protein [Streptomyces scabiei]MDX2570870.1 glycoside hydrolase family 68 protein [Streptomyces scabiei]MDX2629221.1 glycoside hydrolase family 68 protein [Streptomyces scabiei]MDX3150578.1 glycoside hydrolase family 68 protein [Streptomyces scabiei]MDX3157058.1 glycoside hydrolase family 68 protein [Streptomyces scabiei]
MRRSRRVLIRLATGLMALAMTGGVAAPASADEPASSRTGTRQYSADDDYFAVWSRADALKLRQDRTNTAPRVSPDFPVMTDKVWVWDTWPLTELTTKTATYKGWHVIFSLTAPRSVPFGDRHWYAKIGYFYSRDAKSWKYGGDLFKPGTSFGSREWAGSTALVGDKVHSFYTASGRDNGGVDPSDALQRLAQATGKIHADRKRVWFSGFQDHRIIAEADGKLYQTLQQSQAGPIIYAFRDPFVFRDPRDRKIHLLFEGNTGGVAGTYRCTERDIGDVPAGHEVPEDAKYYTGNIGLATADSGSMDNWRLQPPLLSANCVNQQTERPHLVIRNGKYYLFTISHKFTFAPGLSGWDGLYGFVGPSLRSDYRPLNGSALVLGNPEAAPTQQYSHYVMPNGLVESFIDTVPTADGGTRFGGTLARTLLVSLKGDRTKLVKQLDYGFIP